MSKLTPLEVASQLELGDFTSRKSLRRAAQIIREQHLFMEFCSRWTWDKDGSGTSDSEKLGCIKHHPTLTAFRTALEQSNEAWPIHRNRREGPANSARQGVVSHVPPRGKR